DRRDLTGSDGTPRIFEQRAMQVAFACTGVGRDSKLGPRQVRLQELVREKQPAAVGAVEQMMSAGEPEILHGRLLSENGLAVTRETTRSRASPLPLSREVRPAPRPRGPA